MSTVMPQQQPLQDIGPGLYPDIPNEDYHRSPGVSSSGAKLLQRSALHYWEKYLNPEREPDTPTPDMQLGSLVHTLVLEPAHLERDWAVQPKINRRTKAGKEEAAAFEKMNAGKHVVTEEQFRRSQAIAGAVTRHPKASVIFQDGVPEQSLYWIDPDTGVLCKCRPDWWRERFLIADLKTAVDASQDGFERAIFNFGYHISAAMYLDGVKQHTGEDLPFVFSVVEKEPPFAVANYHIHDEAIALGRKQYKEALEVFARCMEKGTDRRHWPGYPLELQSIDLPGWAYRKAG